MRRRLVVSTIAIVLVVLAALAAPVGLIVYDAAEQQLDARIADQATTIAAAISEDAAEGGETDYDELSSLLGPNDGGCARLRCQIEADLVMRDDDGLIT